MRPRDNPFASHRIESLAFRLPAGQSRESLLARLADLQFRAAIVGPEGTGKTTLLDELADRLAAPGRRICRARLRPGRRHFEPGELPPADDSTALLLLDGAEQLGCLAWWRLKRRSRRWAGLLVTSHRPGRLPTLIECTTSPDLLDELLAGLLPNDHAAASPLAHQFFRETRGNIRVVFRMLYDAWATRVP